MEAIQQVGQVLVLTDIQSVIAHHISDGSPIPFNGTGLQFSVFKKCKRKSAIWFTEGDRKPTSFDLHYLIKIASEMPDTTAWGNSFQHHEI